MHTQHTHTFKNILFACLCAHSAYTKQLQYTQRVIRVCNYLTQAGQRQVWYADSQKKHSQDRRRVERQTDPQADMLRAPTSRQTDSCQPDRQLHRGRVVTLNQYTRLLSWNVLTYFCQIHLSVRTCIGGCVRLLIEAHPGCV